MCAVLLLVLQVLVKEKDRRGGDLPMHLKGLTQCVCRVLLLQC